MKLFKKLKLVSMHGYSMVPNIRQVFPELKRLSDEELDDRWDKLGLTFYTEEKKRVTFFTRLTMPFGLLFILLLIILMPVNFLITGYWYWNFKPDSFIINWLRSLRLT